MLLKSTKFDSTFELHVYDTWWLNSAHYNAIHFDYLNEVIGLIEITKSIVVPLSHAQFQSGGLQFGQCFNQVFYRCNSSPIPSLTPCKTIHFSICSWGRYFHSSQAEELAPQFTQMTLSRQGSSENPEPPPMYQAPPTVLSQHPPPQTSYIMATTGQPMPPPSGYQPATGHPHPPPPPPPPSQPVMQAPPPPQGYMQPPPPQQVQCLQPSGTFFWTVFHNFKMYFIFNKRDY